MKNILEKKANKAFRWIILLIISVFGLVVFSIYKIYQNTDIYANILIHKIKDACGCANMSEFFSMHPVISGAFIIFAAVIIGFAVYSLVMLAKMILSTRSYSGYYLSTAKKKHSSKLKFVIKNLNLDSRRIIELETEETAVFCYGFYRPKICISSVLIRMLNMGELKAVLLHEAMHMKTHVPLKLFVVKYFRDVFFFLPAVGDFANNYFILSEMAADEKAGSGRCERRNLAGAIGKIFQLEERDCLKRFLILPSFGSIISERARHLADAAYVPDFRIARKNAILTFVSVIFIFSLVFVFLMDSARAFEMHNIKNCIYGGKQEENPACTQMSIQNVCDKNNSSCQEVPLCKIN